MQSTDCELYAACKCYACNPQLTEWAARTKATGHNNARYKRRFFRYNTCMSMKRDNNETRAIGAGLSIGHDNARDFSAQYGIIITVEGH